MRSESLRNLRAGKFVAFLWLAAAVCFTGLSGCGTKVQRDSAEPLPTDEEVLGAGAVEFLFFFDSDRKIAVTVEGVQAGDTILDCMEKIQEPKIVVNGSGANAFVASIGDKDTAAGEGWSYRVNDTWADRSVGVYEIKPGDVVTWSYGGFEPEQ